MAPYSYFLILAARLVYVNIFFNPTMAGPVASALQNPNHSLIPLVNAYMLHKCHPQLLTHSIVGCSTYSALDPAVHAPVDTTSGNDGSSSTIENKTGTLES